MNIFLQDYTQVTHVHEFFLQDYTHVHKHIFTRLHTNDTRT